MGPGARSVSRARHGPAEAQAPVRRFLHVGCGAQDKSAATSGLNRPDWIEVRFDIDPAAAPDILGSMTDMGAVPDGAMDAVFSSHNLEHLAAHEVPLALAEFRRVLAPGGFAVITCPDLQSLAELVVADRLDQPAYVSEAGPITPLDILYGHGPALAAGQAHMAHRTGFTRRTLVEALQRADFASIAALRRPRSFDLWALATREHQPREVMEHLAAEHLPTSGWSGGA
jgi:SAM-dependent methyltransferase